MGRPVVMRSIKRQRVESCGGDSTEAGQEFVSAESRFASAAGRALRAAPDNKKTPGKRSPVRKRSRK